jgi:hypothetical protein
MPVPSNLILPHHPVSQYMILIRPSESIEHRIKKLKQGLRADYGLQSHQLMGGYLLLARFSQSPSLERALLDRLRLIAMSEAPFRVELSGYFNIPDHSVGIRIANPAGVSRLIKSLRQEQRLMKSPETKPYFNAYPAICLASRLAPEQYRDIWRAFKHRHFNASFIAGNLMVIRKSPVSSQWIVAEEMTFQNLPVLSRQGVLFA